MSKQEMVNHPQHYNMGKYEVIDVIEDWNLDFCLGNAVKYIARAGHKDSLEQDLSKAVWYLNRKLEELREKSAIAPEKGKQILNEGTEAREEND